MTTISARSWTRRRCRSSPGARPARVRSRFAGVRVLPEAGRSTPRIRRETVIRRGPAGMVSVAGGKLTTWQPIGGRAAAMALRRSAVGAPSGRCRCPGRPRRPRSMPRSREPGPTSMRTSGRASAATTAPLRSICWSLPGSGRSCSSGSSPHGPDIWAQLPHARDHEWAATAGRRAAATHHGRLSRAGRRRRTRPRGRAAGGAVTVVCAHRGAAPPSRQLGRGVSGGDRVGADAIEADLRRTPDGRLVLEHDLLAAYPALASAAGRPGDDGARAGEAGHRAEGGWLRARVLEALSPLPPDLLISSFLPSALAAVRELDRSVETALIIERRDPGRPVAVPTGVGRTCSRRTYRCSTIAFARPPSSAGVRWWYGR